MPATATESPQETTPIVGIGASAGGLEPLCAFLSALPSLPGAAFIVVMHLSPESHSELAAILGRRARMPVTEVRGRVALQRDHVYVSPPDRRLEVTDTTVSAVPFARAAERRAAVDLLFHSLAACHGNSFAVVLSGVGADGAVGTKAVKEAGGVILVQDPNEAEFDGMPRAAIATAAADLVLPVDALAERLALLLRDRDSLRRRPAAPEALAADERAVLGHIIGHLNARTGHDFSRYKHATVLRRVHRRMQVHGLHSLRQYLAFLRDTAEEAQGLFRDMLISVTSFFRDAPAWEALRRQVIPKLFDNGSADEPLRIWVPGCASGEEAYSLAMLLLEAAAQRPEPRRIQLFASDLDDHALAIAREGRYGLAIEADVSAERLSRFFLREEAHYQINRELRDTVLFAHHSLLRDPPFARLDLISCRNLLIYLDRELQEQIFGILRYALRPSGYLFLGISEHAGRDYFSVVDKEHCIYVARELTGHALPLLPNMLAAQPLPARTGPEPQTRVQARAGLPATHQTMLEALAPPSVLVDDQRRVIHLSETAGRYLELPPGPVVQDITRIVRRELQAELSAALYAAFEKHEHTLSAFVPVQFNGTPHAVAMLVQPRPARDDAERLALVLFLDAGEARPAATLPEDTEASPAVVQRLKEELSQTHLRLHTARDEFESTNEELRAANEELQSLNEEYRSTAEELETSKEELHSINEELQTLNTELKDKLEEVSRARNDLENLIMATEIPTLFLDRELRIKRFTPQLAELFSIKASDENRPIRDLHRRVRYGTLEQDATRVLQDLAPVEREVTTDQGRWYLARLRPYRTADHHIDGIVVTFVDFTARKDTEDALRRSKERLRAVLERMPSAVVMVDAKTTRIRYINSRANKLYGRDYTGVDLPAHIDGVRALRPDGSPFPFEALPVTRSLRTGESVYDEEMLLRHQDGSTFWVSVNTAPLRDAQGQIDAVICTFEDISARREAEEALRAANRQKNRFLAVLGHELRNPLAAISTTIETLRLEKSLAEPVAQSTEVIGRQVQHLMRLVDDLLNLSRISRGKVELRRRPMDLTESIRDAVAQAQSAIQTGLQQLALELPETPLMVDGDRERLTQILSNLLVNAAHYTGHGGTITLSAATAGDRVRVRVRDTGIGIAAEDLPRVFEPFTRLAEARACHHGGLGLGLALSRQLAELHGGTLVAHSEGQGRGSELTLSLPPLAGDGTGAVDPKPPRVAQLRRRRVLVVDDQPAVGQALVRLLKLLGQDVQLVTHGGEVPAAVAAFKPALVILDIGLPDIDGDEVARRLRDAHGPDAFRLVALTGYGQGAEASAEPTPFDRYLLKPASVEQIKTLLRDF